LRQIAVMKLLSNSPQIDLTFETLTGSLIS
jgi:hypothetical protein